MRLRLIVQDDCPLLARTVLQYFSQGNNKKEEYKNKQNEEYTRTHVISILIDGHLQKPD